MPRSALVLILLVGTTALTEAGLRSAWAESPAGIRVVSNLHTTATGGDVLVELTVPTPGGWIVRLNGHDVSLSFRPREASSDRLALLRGLENGPNTLDVRVNGVVVAKQEVSNYPLSGPIFSGPHQTPFICQTEASGLGPANDADCGAKTLVQYYYKSVDAVLASELKGEAESFRRLRLSLPPALPLGFKPYDPTQPLPKDVAVTVTSEGRRVPYIVRRELGVINRAIYEIRFLHEPGQVLPAPWARGSQGWNGRLVYVFYGGCGAGFHQGVLYRAPVDEVVIAQGYAVATSTLNTFGNSCNDVLSAETASMVKEHFIKSYGVPIHTIGWGPSGGSMQLHLTAQNYPGLLDGIIPFESFPDALTWVTSTTSDCTLLARVFAASKRPLTDQQKSAITGFATWRTCADVAKDTGFTIGPAHCASVLPQSEIYEPSKRRSGVRCDIYDNEINVFGRDDKTGFARRPLDNVGVQYGLAALNSGGISLEDFFELNAHVGGFDIDGNIVRKRTHAAAEVVRRAYRHGLVLGGGAGLRATPIIDWRWYTDATADMHGSFESFVTRARLSAANGTAANQVILIVPADTNEQNRNFDDPNPQTSLIAQQERTLIGQMDRWLDQIAADGGAGTPLDKVIRDKPAELSDGCWTERGEKISGTGVFGATGRCSRLYPQHANPRIAAGAPITDDILKCRLKPVVQSDYSQRITPQQLTRLKRIFPGGVCDYTKPGVGQQAVHTTWQRY